MANAARDVADRSVRTGQTRRVLEGYFASEKAGHLAASLVENYEPRLTRVVASSLDSAVTLDSVGGGYNWFGIEQGPSSSTIAAWAASRNTLTSRLIASGEGRFHSVLRRFIDVEDRLRHRDSDRLPVHRRNGRIRQLHAIANPHVDRSGIANDPSAHEIAAAAQKRLRRGRTT